MQVLGPGFGSDWTRNSPVGQAEGVASVLIGVSGGIAAYKAVHLVRLAIGAGHSVRVLTTPGAERFVGAATFEGISGAPVLRDEFEPDPMRGAYPGEQPPSHAPISHLALAERADAIVVAPATANTIAKLAAGICDSMLTTSFLAATAPRLVAPAMNERMWRAAATRENVETLRRRGVEVLEPGEGALASRGEHGVGRMPEPEEIIAALDQSLERSLDEVSAPAPRARDLAGLRVLVTAGGTREPIDAVRFIGNRSSGRMGFAIAERAVARGAEVTVIAANVGLSTPPGVRRLDVVDVAELAARVEVEFERSDVLLMAAAASDFRPESPVAGKPAREGMEAIDLRLVPTEDVLAGLAGSRRPDQTVIGFAAEHGGEFVARARDKLRRKGVDAIVVNDVSDPEVGFDSARNEVTIIDRDERTRSVPRGPKRVVAEAILDQVVAMRAVPGGSGT